MAGKQGRVILNKADSTITVQFQQQTGLTQNNDIGIGIESITGDIGLQHSADTYPPVNYAIRYYNPSVPLLTVIDASLEWNSFEGNQGVTLATNASPFTMTVNVRNTGNAIVSNFDVTGSVRNTGGTVLATDVHMAFLYGAARYNAHVARNIRDVTDHEAFVEEMAGVYKEMLRNHLAADMADMHLLKHAG